MSPFKITPVILCGGSGTRLWPLSRKSFPKQFLSLNSHNSQTLLQETYTRILGLKGLQNPILICNEEHRFIAAEQMRGINIKPKSILLEPYGKGTLAAITLAAIKSFEDEDDPILIVLSSDHFIKNHSQFIKVIEQSLKDVLKDKIVCFGIKPNKPATGYGYIKAKEPFTKENPRGISIKKFMEKPNLEMAKTMYKDPFFFWNSGIFFFKAKTILNEVKKFHPEVFNLCEKSLSKSSKDLDFQRLDKNTFEKCPNLSIDIAVMERTKLGMIFPIDIGWRDIGSWDAVWEISKKSDKNNFLSGNVIVEDSQNCYLRSENRLLVALGIKELVVVETSDAILVANKNNSQEIKDIVEKLKNENLLEGVEHKKIYRPWGFYETLIEERFWKVKLIKVKSGESLSLQMHKFRSENWVVVNGTATVQINQKTIVLQKNQNISIPAGSLHRLSNNNSEDLKIIEVQSGSYLGEDDITRFEDNYGRNK